jgi:hypothetical protein
MSTVNEYGHVTFSPEEIRSILKRRAVLDLHTSGQITRKQADALHQRDDCVLVGTASAGIAIAFTPEPVQVHSGPVDPVDAEGLDVHVNAVAL